MPRAYSGRLLKGARVYLSGPMDFVASRAAEKKFGWRNRVGDLLRRLGVTVLDPWNKPEVRGLYEYGREDERTTAVRDLWTFDDSPAGAAARARCSGSFWPSFHIDLRMVDTSDFIIAYCPTNIYSVGTPHEIVMCRIQHKPVLFVSPQVTFPALAAFRNHLKDDPRGLSLLEKLTAEVPIKENPTGAPSLWYMPLIGGEGFFDGFGFAPYRKKFGWPEIPLDRMEADRVLKRPLLPFLEKASGSLPRKWDNGRKRYIRNDDWLLWDLKIQKRGGGAKVVEPRLGKVEREDQE